MIPLTSSGYSAQVRMTLHVGGHCVRVGQMGPNFLILVEPFATQAHRGTVRLTVDDVTEEIPVLLPKGIPSGADRVETAEVQVTDLAAA